MLGTIKKFTDLIAWQQSHELALMIYKYTDTFPSKEQFGLVSQMRRAVISIGSNIAEGFSRQSKKEKVQFYHIALGSNTELHNQILVSRDVNYLSNQDAQACLDKVERVYALLRGIIRSARLGSRDTPYPIPNTSL